MSASPATRRAIAEIDFGDEANLSFKVGNRSIHQFWHLFSSHFRHVLLAPQRRADSGKVAWTWREAGEKRPVTATELVEVRRRLSEANRSLAGGFGGIGRRDDDEASSLDGQVRAGVGEMVDQLLAQRDSALAGFVCRTDAGLMLHSWGAAVAAQPHFPDAQQCEISGTVFVGVERAASVTVALENAQGIGGARVKSDKEGVFRFPSVAPGRYHLRVADRSDFSGGLTVEIEREPIVGLELRSTSDEPLTMAGNIKPGAQDVPWFRRGWAAVVLVVLVLGGGTMTWWWSKRSSDAPAVAQNHSSSWQSAKGQLAANDSQTPTNDDHKVGQEGAFSALSNSIPPPKVLHPRRDRAPSEPDGMASEHAAQPSEDSAVPGRIPEETSLSTDSTRKPTPRPDAPPVPAPRERPNSSSGSAEEKMRPSEEGLGVVPDDEIKSAKDKLVKSPRPATDRKKTSTPGSSSPPGNESPDEGTAPAGSDAPADSAMSAAARSSGEKSSPRGGAKNSTATGAAANAEAAESNADAGAPDSPMSGSSAAANGQLKLSPVEKARESAKVTTANTAAAVSADSTAPDSVANMPDGPTSPETPASKGAPKNPALKKTPTANQTATEADSNPPPDQADKGSPPVSPPTAPSGKPAKRPPAAVAGKSAPAAPVNELPASPAEAQVDPSSESQFPDPAGNTPPSKRSNSKKKSTPHQSPQGDEADQSAGEQSAANLSAMIPPATTAAVGLRNDDPLVRIGKVHASVWKQRMVRDVIVPTRPVTEAEDEALDTLRKNLRREQTMRLPKAFQQPRLSSGFVIEFATTSNRQNSPHWRDGLGAEPIGSSVSGQRAELSWSGGVPPANTTYTLSDSAGRVLAVASVDGDGAVALKTTATSNAWYWCGIECAAVRSTDARPGDVEPPFDWKLLSGAAVPASWMRDDRWLGGRGQRLDIPLDASTKRVGNYQIALIDPVTGWALVSDVGVRAP